MKLKGPELKKPDIKMPELKAPAFLADLYYDLRDRRLLPLIALVVVAIVAVPILRGGVSEEPAVATGNAATPEAGGAKTSSLTVVEATPGLRDYRKRLRGRAASDPFEQQYTGPTSGGSSSGNGATSTSEPPADSGAVSVGGEESGEAGAAPGGSSPSGGGSSGSAEVDPDDPGLRFYAFRPDVRFGVAGSDKLSLYRNLPLGETLPKQKPVVVFLGVSEDGKRAAFDVSGEVAVVRGPGRCVGGNQSCSLLILHAGQAVDILTGAPGRTFRLDLVRIDFVEVDPPQTAHSSAAAQRWAFGFFQNFSK
jgi:hypothetical protein